MVEYYQRYLIKWLLNNNPMQLKKVCKELKNVLTFELISFVNDIKNDNLKIYKKKGNYPINYLAHLSLKNYKL